MRFRVLLLLALCGVVRASDAHAKSDSSSSSDGPTLLPVGGILFGAGQGASAYIGGALFLLPVGPLAAGIKLDVRPGIEGGSVGGGMLACLDSHAGFAFELEAMARLLKDWDEAPLARGVEVGLTLVMIKTTYGLYWSPSDRGSPTFLFGAGFGFL